MLSSIHRLPDQIQPTFQAKLRCLNRYVSIAIATSSVALLIGCNAFEKQPSLSKSDLSNASAEPNSKSDSSVSSADSGEGSPQVIANPVAKTIRFDGREVVLGTASVKHLTLAEFESEFASLVKNQKFFTAADFIERNQAAAEQFLWERCGSATNETNAQFVADVLSRNVPPTISWNGLLQRFTSNGSDATEYQKARSQIISSLKAGSLSDVDAKQLKAVSQQISHPLVMIDTLRLLAFAELVSGRNAWAESLFMQACEIADQHGDLARASELWMMVATTANRSERIRDAEKAWRKAVEQHCASHNASNRPVDVSFWLRADEQLSENIQWPPSISAALLRHCKSVGCDLSRQQPVEFILWCAVATAQYENRQPQLALVNYKKAESFAEGDDVQWLRIAQGKCLAALGQTHASIALLSEPAISSNRRVAAAANAAMGSAKLHAGVYQQAASLLAKSLSDAAGESWPTKSQAEADLALARLIIGDTDQGLQTLHEAQKTFQQQGDTASLIQSLENEVRILEHEKRTPLVATIQDRIRQLEAMNPNHGATDQLTR